MVTITKANSNRIPSGIKDPTHTYISWSLALIAVSVMAFLGIRHITGIGFEAAWGAFAVAQAVWGCIGLFGTQVIKQEPVFLHPKSQFKDFNLNTGVAAGIILVAAMVTQVITQFVLSISTTEQALYYVFSAVCEELFFRLFLINFITQLSDKRYMKLIAVLIESFFFAAVHRNYYSNPGMLAGVFLGGIVFGLGYILTKDITPCILAHFILNLIATSNWLVTLG